MVDAADDALDDITVLDELLDFTEEDAGLEDATEDLGRGLGTTGAATGATTGLGAPIPHVPGTTPLKIDEQTSGAAQSLGV